MADEEKKINNNCCECECVCCDCEIYTKICNKGNCQTNTEYNMNPFNSYNACLYPVTRSASVIPTINTNNNLYPQSCNNNTNCVNQNFPGSSADLCTYNSETNTARIGIRLYKAGVPQRTFADPVAPIIPEPKFGMMNCMSPACMRQCNNKGKGACGQVGNNRCN